MDDKRTKVTIYADGACLGNPGPGGYGVILICGDRKKELSGGAALTTNNRMELTAVIEGLKALKRPCEVLLYSDSKYVVDMVEENGHSAGKKIIGCEIKKSRLKMLICGRNSYVYWRSIPSQ